MRKMTFVRRVALCLWLALSLLPVPGPAEGTQEAAATPTAAPTARPYGEEMDGTIRVMLQSLGARVALGMTLDGAYTVEGDRGFQFEPGTEISLGIDGGHVVLKVGGATIDMGASLQLVRHLDAEGNAGGLYIHESEKDMPYPGDVSIEARDGSLRVIVAMDIEAYLYGVVPYEMSDTFPLEALKAQAIAARTYAMQRKVRRAKEAYDVVDTANDQVYKGLDVRFEAPIAAVDATRGIVGMHDGTYAECFYSASNGGQTALANDVWGDGDFAYLDIRDDPYDLANPQSVVKTALVPRAIDEVPLALHMLLSTALEEALFEDGQIEAGEVVSIDALEGIEAVEPVYGGESRQYGTIRFTVTASVQRLMEGADDAFQMLGDAEPLGEPVTLDLSFYDQVRSALGIGINSSRYDLVTVEEAEDGFLFTNRRYGHGVGLSQRGAQQMAGQEGMDYLEILAFYYPGLEMVQMAWTLPALTPADALPESLGYAAPRPTPQPTPGPLPALAEGEYYAIVMVEGVDSVLNVREEPSTLAERVGTVRGGARLIVEEETEDGWAKMKTAELEGYVLMSFLAPEG